MKRQILILAAIPLGLLLLLLGLGWWLLSTQTGSEWVLNRLSDQLGDQFRFQSMSGSFRSGVTLNEVTSKGAGYSLMIPSAQIVVEFSITAPGLRVPRAEIFDPRYQILEPTTTPSLPQAHDELMRSLVAPVNLQIERFVLKNLQLLKPSGDRLLQIEKIQLEVNWRETLDDINLALEMEGLTAQVQGKIDLAQSKDHELELTAFLKGTWIHEDLPPDLELNLQTSGDASRVHINLASPSTALSINGVLDTPLSHPEVELQFDLAQWPLAAGHEAPGLHHLTGTVTGWLTNYRINAQGVLQWPGVEHFELDFQAEGDTQALSVQRLVADASPSLVSSSGELRFESPPVVMADINWKDLDWSSADTSAAVKSESGSLTLRGTTEQWEALIDGVLATDQYPGGRFVAEADGSSEAANFKILEGAVLGGTLQAQGEVQWADELRLNSEFGLEQVDVGVFLPDHPAVLDARGRLVLKEAPQRFLRIDLDQLVGEVHSEPLEGRGTIIQDGEYWSFEDFQLSSGSSRISADGGLDDPRGLLLNIDVQRPGWIADLAQAEVKGQLRLMPHADQPIREMELVATHLQFGRLKLERLEANTAAEDDGGGLKISASGLSVGDETLDLFALVIDGSAERQNGTMELAAGDLRLTLSLAGEVVDWTQLKEAGWRGTINALGIWENQKQLLYLDAPAPVLWTANAYEIGQACLNDSREGQICATARCGDTHGLNFDLQFLRLPLQTFERFLDQDLALTQLLDGSLNWKMPIDQAPSGAAELTLSPGELKSTRREDLPSVQTGHGQIRFNLVNGALQAGRVILPLPGNGQIDLNFGVQNLTLAGAGALEGTARVTLADLSLLELLSNGTARNFQGRLDSELQLSGVLASPSFSGSIHLDRGGFEIPALNAVVTDIDLNGEVSSDNHWRMEGPFRMGAGQGNILFDARFPADSPPNLDLRLSGERLEALSLPDLTVEASPDLSLQWNGEFWNIGGRLDIPVALIEPASSVVQIVEESVDVQVTEGQRPVQESTGDAGLELQGELQVVLGDQVQVRMDIAQLDLTGNLDLHWTDSRVPMAEGQVFVQGEVTAWGPRLTVSDGRIRWPGVTVDNPRLDLRAERDVFGNTVVRSAGVHVAGTATRPEIEAYTLPFTTRERAWAVLITGSDVNFGQGIGALDVGTYIAPRIYLSYGIGLFDNDNVVGVRYDLKKGWGVKAVSGSRESGIDLSYTIEK